MGTLFLFSEPPHSYPRINIPQTLSLVSVPWDFGEGGRSFLEAKRQVPEGYYLEDLYAHRLNPFSAEEDVAEPLTGAN